MTANKILNSNLLKEGSRFIVLPDPKDGSITPYSVGFMSCYNPTNCQNNMIRAHVVILKRGKTGMERVEKWDVFLPIYHNDTIHPIMTAKKVKYYIHMKAGDNGKAYDLRTTAPLDFIGWAVSKYEMLKRVNAWYGNKTKMNSADSETISVLDQSVMGLFRHDAEGTKELYSDHTRKENTVYELRVKESEQIKSVLYYHKAMVEAHLQAIGYLETVNEGSLLPNTLINSTKESILKEHTGILNLIAQHSTTKI